MKKVLPKIGLSAIENQRFIDILSVDEYQLFQLLTHISFLNYFSSFFQNQISHAPFGLHAGLYMGMLGAQRIGGTCAGLGLIAGTPLQNDLTVWRWQSV